MDAPRKHLLTVSVEDYFHSGSLDSVVVPKHWTRIESRLEKSIRDVIDLLGESGVNATFFVLGWIAERQPEIVRLIRSAGHEIASRGYVKGIEQSPSQLREDMQRAREALEAAGSNRIYGYRHWRWIMRPEELWILDAASEEGYAYDSSINPILRRFAREPRRFEAHTHRAPEGARTIRAFPVSTTSVWGHRVAFSGGNYLRQFPHSLMSRAAARWHRSSEAPMLFYFFPWEIDSDQPHIQGLPMLQQIRHYRRLGKTRHVLRKYFKQYAFQPVGDHLELPWRTAPVEVRPRKRMPEIRTDVDPQPPPDADPVTVVVPFYNEETTVSYLQGALIDLKRRLGGRYRIHFNLVDDGSSDRTWDRLQERFADFPDCRLIRHERNKGVAAALLTGIREAPSEIVASIDCDCSYDPAELEVMLPMLESADLVTASPYHPAGGVFNVPPWRLFLSRTLSSMYSALLGSELHTYTSCFRVYRKSAMEKQEVKHRGFLGVAEMLIRLRLSGGRIVEYPTTLESRLFGESKMKIVRTIWSHLGLLRELSGLRLRGKIASAPVATSEDEAPVPREAAPAPKPPTPTEVEQR